LVAADVASLVSVHYLGRRDVLSRRRPSRRPPSILRVGVGLEAPATSLPTG